MVRSLWIACAAAYGLAAGPGLAAAPPRHPTLYLASITGLTIGKNEFVDGFSIDTWGVRMVAVCHFPPGWSIDAGSSADPSGLIKGEGSLGVTWLDRTRLDELDGLVLLDTEGGIRRADEGHEGASVYVPATFKGKVSIGTYGTDKVRKMKIGWRNIRLTPAVRCPPPKQE
ncbi:hypothetical protein [Asticcacaulis solisilvae]|uniref:hypothetical protein n=1 Tax=Asticcacaulis solisilvae TaxID=1217274 RepID=UPI003FD6E83E